LERTAGSADDLLQNVLRD